jgi:HlyD family secretion protein
MTVADLSVLQIELEVGEADILDVRLGHDARVEIDALPNRKLKGKVTEVGTSPILHPQGQQDRGVAFRVIVTLDETVEGVRPGFSASAEIVTATRTKALAVPIRALVGREQPAADGKKVLKEGAIVVRDGKSLFVAVRMGIRGKEHYETLEGLAEGDEVVTGPNKTVRELKDGELLQRKSE